MKHPRTTHAWLVPSTLALALAACATQPTAPDAPPSPAPVAAAAAAPTKVELAFVDLDSFDRAMEKALASGAAVEVNFVAPMSPNSIAPRLGRWLNTVQDNGGEVVVKNDTKTRSLSLVTALLDAVYGAWRDMRLRNLVKDVKAEVDVSQNEIRRVSFTRKPAEAAGQ